MRTIPASPWLTNPCGPSVRGQTASDEDIRMVHTLVRELLSSLLGSNGIGIQILYGGSVKPDNAKAILSLDNVDGLLVGGASLQAQKFCRHRPVPIWPRRTAGAQDSAFRSSERQIPIPVLERNTVFPSDRKSAYLSANASAHTFTGTAGSAQALSSLLKEFPPCRP